MGLHWPAARGAAHVGVLLALEEAGLLSFDQMVPCMQAGYEAVKQMTGTIEAMFRETAVSRIGKKRSWTI